MKTIFQKLTGPLASARGAKGALACLVAALFTAGCQTATERRASIRNILSEESRALTSAVVDVLQLEPAAERDVHSATALQLAKQDQRIEGLPLQPIDALALLQTNDAVVAEVQERFALQNRLIRQERVATDNLVSLGIEKDAENRARRNRLAKWTAAILGSLGTLLVLAILCPALLPIIGRALAWLVGKIPALANAAGVVSVKAFDAVVRGVEKTKEELGASPVAIRAANAGAEDDSRRARTSAEQVRALLENLSRELDAEHKALVRARRTAQA